jgi:hypothetical protein
MARLKYQPGKTLFAAPYDWRQDQQSGLHLAPFIFAHFY